MGILGSRVARTEDPVLLTRGGTYTADVRDDRLARALHVTFVRSPIAHARITGIDVSAAAAAPGVADVVTGDDLGLAPALLFRSAHAAMRRPFLATDTVRHVGDPVVAVLTDTAARGEDAADLVAVDYEPLPPLVDVEQAARDEVLLFAEAGTNTAAVLGPPDGLSEDLFDGCEVVLTQRLVNQRLAAVPLETRAAAAAWGEDGRVTIWLPTQSPQAAKTTIATWLGVAADRVHVITPDVGGGFGAKIGADPEHAVVAALARRNGRPVRWSETRSANLVAMQQGRGHVQTITIGGRRDGRVEAYRLEVLADAGAYPRVGVFLPSFTRAMAPGVYDIARVESRARAVVTTTPSIGAYRGAGRPEATTAIERAMDLFAAEIGMDPAEVRRRNLVPAAAFPFRTATGVTYDSGDYPQALQRVLAAADYTALRAEQQRRRARGDTLQLGIGVSTYVEVTGANQFAETASVEVHDDGRVTVLTGTSPQGQGHATTWAMLAADVLDVPVRQITVRHGDTDLIPEGAGTMGSRSLQTGGVAVRQAATELVELAKARATELLEVAADDLEVAGGRVGVRGDRHAAVTLAEIAAAAPLRVDTVFDSGAPTFPFGAHVAVVEVDLETAQVVLSRLVALDDAGTIVNPMLAEGQRHGGIAQGIAQALFEEVRHDEDGNPVTATLVDYTVPSAADLPDFTLLTMATPTHLNPLGAKGIGESGTIGATPAVQSAVVDALAHLGVRHLDMPATPLRVWRAIAAASGSPRSVHTTL